MPRLQDLERFKRDLAALSHEADVLERWGEKPEVIPPPDGEPAAPSQAATDKPNPPLPETTVEDEGLPPDFAALLDNLPIDREKPEAGSGSVDDELAAFLAAPEEKESPPEPSAMPDFDVPTFAAEPPETDNGAVELFLLNYWRKVGCGGHKIGAFMAVSPQSTTLVKDGLYLFGGLYTGIALPISAQHQQVWDVPPGGIIGAGFPGSWGGHAVPILDYDMRGLTCITWGQTKRMTWGFLKLYCDEAYAILSTDFLLAGKAPNGFNITQLQADLAAL